MLYTSHRAAQLALALALAPWQITRWAGESACVWRSDRWEREPLLTCAASLAEKFRNSEHNEDGGSLSDWAAAIFPPSAVWSWGRRTRIRKSSTAEGAGRMTGGGGASTASYSTNNVRKSTLLAIQPFNPYIYWMYIYCMYIYCIYTAYCMYIYCMYIYCILYVYCIYTAYCTVCCIYTVCILYIYLYINTIHTYRTMTTATWNIFT